MFTEHLQYVRHCTKSLRNSSKQDRYLHLLMAYNLIYLVKAPPRDSDKPTTIIRKRHESTTGPTQSAAHLSDSEA